MSRLCRLRNAKHGDDGQWAYNEIVSLRRELKNMTDQYNAALEAEQVRYRQVVEKDAEIERLRGMVDEIQAARHVHREHNRLLTNLASSQAREQQLREALEGAYDYVEEAINRRIEEYGETFRPHRLEYIREVKAAADKALALPKDTTAMSALITKAGEVMRERCAVECETHYNFSNALAAAIRALAGVTLADLKGAE